MNLLDFTSELKQRFEMADRVMHQAIMPKVINEIAPVIEDKITAQLDQGIRGDGRTLPIYSETSVEVYGKPPGPIRLDETGAFRQGIKVSADAEGVTIKGEDPKTDQLVFDYGIEIIEPTEQSWAELNEDYIIEESGKLLNEYLSYGTESF